MEVWREGREGREGDRYGMGKKEEREEEREKKGDGNNMKGEARKGKLEKSRKEEEALVT